MIPLPVVTRPVAPALLVKVPPLAKFKVQPAPTVKVLPDAMEEVAVVLLTVRFNAVVLDSVKLLLSTKPEVPLMVNVLPAVAACRVTTLVPLPPMVIELSEILGTPVMVNVALAGLITTSSPATGVPPVQLPVVVQTPPVVVEVQVLVAACVDCTQQSSRTANRPVNNEVRRRRSIKFEANLRREMGRNM